MIGSIIIGDFLCFIYHGDYVREGGPLVFLLSSFGPTLLCLPWVALSDYIAIDIQIHKTRRGSVENELFRFHDIKRS